MSESLSNPGPEVNRDAQADSRLNSDGLFAYTVGNIARELAVSRTPAFDGTDDSARKYLLWIEDEKRWIEWSRGRWVVRETVESVMHHPKDWLYFLRRNAEKMDLEQQNRVLSKLIPLNNPGQWLSILQAYKTEDRARTISDQWDDTPEYLPTKDCLLVLARKDVWRANPHRSRSVRILPYTPDRLSRVRTGIEYDSKAACPVFDKFLMDICSGDEKIASFLLRYFGCAISGYNDEDKILVLLGAGRNGKTTLVETFKSVFGDLAAQLEVETILERADTKPEYHLARLPGKRLVCLSELPESRRINQSLLKAMSGGGILTGRKPAGQPFEFSSRGKIVIDANRLPTFDGGSNAIRARLIVVPLHRNFVEEGLADPTLYHKLAQERPGILNRLIQGYYEYAEHGLAPPKSISTVTSGVLEENDPVGEFLEANYAMTWDGRVTYKDVRTTWTDWCKEQRLPKVTQEIDIVREVAARPGISRKNSHSVRYLVGLDDTFRAGTAGTPVLGGPSREKSEDLGESPYHGEPTARRPNI